MIDLEKFVLSLKASWVKRLLAEKTGVWKDIYIDKLKQFGGLLIFESNIKCDDILKHFPQDTFIQNVLIAWRKVCEVKVLSINKTIIWNNSDIKINGKTSFFKTWFERGIKLIESIYDYRVKQFYTFEYFSNLYDIPNSEFLKYISLIAAIPNDMKRKLKSEQINAGNNNSSFIDVIRKSKHANKLFYNLQLKREIDENIIQQIRWEEEF